MNAFKRKSLYAAVVAGLGAAGGAMQAGAVNISNDNTGEVLLYPYYTVRAGFTTSISIVNTSTSHTKAVKVRFLEGKNSAEVLDFNLFLSPRDVWTGVVTDSGAGAQVSTTDRSCTAPQVTTTGIPFSNAYYSGLSTAGAGTNDNGGTTLDRTREGYIEVIEMGVVANAADLASTPSTATGINVASAVKHTAAGSPSNCATVRVNGLLAAGDILQPVGGLMGNGIMINTATGTEFAYIATGLDNFSATALYSNPGDLTPNLNNVNPATSFAFASGTPTPITDTWPVPIDAVSALFMHSRIQNEYDVTAATGFALKTDWVITMPTKRFYVEDSLTLIAGPVPPFQNAFTGIAPGASACDPVFVAAYDREEAPYAATVGIVFSPAVIGAPAGTGNLCWESTVMSVVPNGGSQATSNVFNSANFASITLPANGTGTPIAPSYNAGWISLTPTRTLPAGGPGQTAVGDATGNPVVTNEAQGGLGGVVGPTSGLRYRGLPVFGFAAIAYGPTPTSVGGLGGVFAHKYITAINAP